MNIADAARSPRVTVLSRRELRSWPKHDRGGAVEVLPFALAVAKTYETDAHFSAYVAPNGRRLSSDAPGQVDVQLDVIAFDVDCIEVHRTSDPAPDWWRNAERMKLAALRDVHPAPFVYDTRGGYRVVYALPEPELLRTREDAVQWSRQYLIACAYFERRFGVEADRACADWTRLFRLPHVTRAGSSSAPETLPTFGDPSDLGVLRIDASRKDVQAAERAGAKTFSNARRLDFAPCSADGRGLLYHALRARGALIREHGATSFVIRCPREHLHSTGSTGNGSTLLYLPAAGCEVGAINCKHAHCAHLTVRDWLGEFSRAELDDARRAAGIATRRAA